MNSARQHAPENQGHLEQRKGPSRPLMPAMPAGPDYWPVPVAAPPGRRRPRGSSSRPDGRTRVQAP